MVVWIGNDIWLWGSQILINVSDGAEVYNNTVYVHEGGGNGIGIMHYDRTDVPGFGPFHARNNYIHHNEVTYLGLGGDGSPGYSGIVDDAPDGYDTYKDADGDGAPI